MNRLASFARLSPWILFAAVNTSVANNRSPMRGALKRVRVTQALASFGDHKRRYQSGQDRGEANVLVLNRALKELAEPPATEVGARQQIARERNEEIASRYLFEKAEYDGLSWLKKRRTAVPKQEPSVHPEGVDAASLSQLMTGLSQSRSEAQRHVDDSTRTLRFEGYLEGTDFTAEQLLDAARNRSADVNHRIRRETPALGSSRRASLLAITKAIGDQVAANEAWLRDAHIDDLHNELVELVAEVREHPLVRPEPLERTNLEGQLNVEHTTESEHSSEGILTSRRAASTSSLRAKGWIRGSELVPHAERIAMRITSLDVPEARMVMEKFIRIQGVAGALRRRANEAGAKEALEGFLPWLNSSEIVVSRGARETVKLRLFRAAGGVLEHKKFFSGNDVDRLFDAERMRMLEQQFLHSIAD